MKVVVYVEGPSDKIALPALLSPLLKQKRQEGVAIRFFETPSGDRKASVITKVPIRAVNILRNDSEAVVVALPDLYPRDKTFSHETCDELAQGILERFNNALVDKGVTDDSRVRDRFRVFCLKHDLEVLLLASEEALKDRLGIRRLDKTWQEPVEDQNHGNPPKRIVEDLFAKYGKKYQSTVDAPAILRMARYVEVAGLCPQCFQPFVKFLSSLRSS